MNWKILLVDDIPEMVSAMQRLLENEFYQVQTATSGEEALQKVDKFDPDIIILDVHMPGKDGIAICQELRRRPGYERTGNKRIIMLSVTRNGPSDPSIGYAAGADNYLRRPLDPSEFRDSVKVQAEQIARLQSMQAVMPNSEKPMEIDEWLIIYPAEEAVQVNGEKKYLQSKLFKLLWYLAKNINKVCTQDNIIGAVWPEAINHVESANVAIFAAIRRLRKEIEPDPRHPKYLITRNRSGYILIKPNDIS